MLGHWDHAVVDDLDDLVTSEVEVHDETFDGTRVSVVERVGAQERDAARDAAIGLGVVSEHAGGPGIDLHVVDVGDATASERREVLGVLLGGKNRVHRLAEQQGGPNALDHLPADDRVVGQRNDDLDHAESRTVHELYFDRARGGPVDELRLVRLVQDDVHEGGIGREPRIGAYRGTRPADLVAGEHFEGMGGHGRMLSVEYAGVKRWRRRRAIPGSGWSS